MINVSLILAQTHESHAWLVYLTGGILITACVLLHNQVVRLLIRLGKAGKLSKRAVMIAPLLVLIFTHLVEIGLFGLGFLFLNLQTGTGGIAGQENLELTDYFYLSGVTFTTVGYGDITPLGPLRLFAVIEALCGLMLVTWSASFTFLIMTKLWESEKA